MITLTHATKPVRGSEIKRIWHLVDANGQVLGRLTPGIAKFLQGKHKTNYVPYIDSGDYVVVINAAKVRLTGRKDQVKEYTRYSGYPGGLKKVGFEEMLAEKPAEVIKHAVSGMLPKNKLRDQRLARLYIFADEKNPYSDKFK